MTKFIYKMIPTARDILSSLIIIFMIIFCVWPVSAREWYENGNLHEASIRQWKAATYSNKLATSAGFIAAVRNDGYFLHDGKINSDNPLKRLSEILVENTDEYVKITINQDEPISKIVLQVMLELGWIKQNYLIFLAKSAHTTPSSKINEATHTPDNNKTVKLPTTQSIKIRKYRRMSYAEGRIWVKKNIIPVMTFTEDKLVERFGKYEKTTERLTSKKILEKYYFKRIDMTFFVIQEDKTLIGFCEGKGFIK